MEDFHFSQPISSVRHVAFPFPKSWRDSPELTRIKEAFNWMVDFGLFTLYETKFADGKTTYFTSYDLKVMFARLSENIWTCCQDSADP